MSDWEDRGWLTLEELKQTLTIPEVLEMLDVEVDSSGKFTSPWNPTERTPSAHAYEDHVYDYSTGRGGDLVDLVQAYYPEMTINDVVRSLSRKALRAGREPGDVERQPVRQVVDFTEQLVGFNHVDTLLRNQWAHLHPPSNCREGDGNLLIPHCDSEGCYGVKVREPGGAKTSWPGSQPTKRLYCMHGWRGRGGDHVYVVEGETDAWALQSILPDAWVLALPSGASSFKQNWLDDLPKALDAITIIFDNDRAGEEARLKWDRETKWSVRHVYVPPLANDIRETGTRWPEWRP